VPVHIFVPVVLVHFQAQLRYFREKMVGHSRVYQQLNPRRRPARPGREQESLELVRYPLPGYDLQPCRERLHRLTHKRIELQAKLGNEPRGAEDPQWIVGERVLGSPRRAQDLVLKVAQAAERIDELMPRQPDRHRVDCEIPAGQILGQRGPISDAGLSRRRAVRFAAVRRYFKQYIGFA